MELLCRGCYGQKKLKGIQVEMEQVLETGIWVCITHWEAHGNEELGSPQYRSLRVHVAPSRLLSVIKTLPGPWRCCGCSRFAPDDPSLQAEQQQTFPGTRRHQWVDGDFQHVPAAWLLAPFAPSSAHETKAAASHYSSPGCYQIGL